MALIKCEECGKEISDTANICPHCGIELKHKKEVKNKIEFDVTDILIIILLVIYSGFMLFRNFSFTLYTIYYIINILVLWLIYLLYKFNILSLKIITGIILLLDMIIYIIWLFPFSIKYLGIFRTFLSFISDYAIYMLLYLVVLRRKNGTS